MALAPAITNIEELKAHPALARLLEWNPAVPQSVKFDRDELTIWVLKETIRVYHLLSIPTKERVRLKARLDGSSPVIESVTSVWPSANFYEREVFDLFGVRFTGHPNLKRIMMPDDWEGHPLRKDYPVEGYR